MIAATRFNGCHCGDKAFEVACSADYCDPKPHPHEAAIVVHTPWLPVSFAPVCQDALDAMKADPAVQGLWDHHRKQR